LSSHLLSKNLLTEVHKTILPAVLYGCETLSFTLREEQIEGAEEIFGPKGEEMVEVGENCLMISFITFMIHRILL